MARQNDKLLFNYINNRKKKVNKYLVPSYIRLYKEGPIIYDEIDPKMTEYVFNSQSSYSPIDYINILKKCKYFEEFNIDTDFKYISISSSNWVTAVANSHVIGRLNGYPKLSYSGLCNKQNLQYCSNNHTEIILY